MAASQSDAFGMAQLHCPDEPTIDICFVHGLGGGQRSTWTLDEICWPSDLLPADIPNARILSFGYDAKVAQVFHKVSQNSPSQHATNLLEALIGNRDTSFAEKRPVIFVAHSLGGLICAEALLKAAKHIEDTDKNVEKSTMGMAFLATPFQGSDQSEWASLGARLAKMVGESNEELPTDLAQDNKRLATLAKDFSEWLRSREADKAMRVRMVCFKEELSTAALGLIVTGESASIQGYHLLSLRADHQGICKFSGKEDEKYQAVLKVLQKWTKEIESATREKKPQETQATNNFYTNLSGDDNKGQIGGQLTNANNAPLNFGTWNAVPKPDK